MTRRGSFGAGLLLAVLVLAPLVGAVAPDPGSNGTRNGLGTLWGPLATPLPRASGNVTFHVRLDPGAVGPAARHVLFLVNTPDDHVRLDHPRLTTAAGEPVAANRTQVRHDGRELAVDVTPANLTANGTGNLTLLLSGHVTLDANRRALVNGLVIAFDGSWRKTTFADGTPQELYGYTTVGTYHAAGGLLAPPLVGSGNVGPPWTPAALVAGLAAVGILAVALRRRVNPRDGARRPGP